MTQPKQAAQGWGDGEMFVEVAEKKLPDFWFLGRGGIGAWWSQKTALPEKAPRTYTSEDQ
jgi:hypothetical protein